MAENEKISLNNVSSDSFLQLGQQISFKSLPPLGTENLLEDIKTIKQLKKHSDAHPRKNILHSFVKTATLERPKRKYQKGQDLRKSNPELNIRKMRRKVIKENGFTKFDIQKFGKKIINHFKKEISEPGPSRMCKNEKQNRKSVKLQFDTNKKTETNIENSFEKLNINEIKSSSQYQFNILENSEILKSDSLGHSSELMENANVLDLSSGDVRNLNLNSDDACSSKNCIENQFQILSSKKKSVQWNREVEVVYYAGDINGGKIVKREREPLREETDQQARHKKFIDLVLEKNLMTLTKGFHFPYS